MKGRDVVHSSTSDEWETPEWLFDYFDNKYNFGLDAAASDKNRLCTKWFTEEDNALKQSWKGYGNVFVNPPYSKNQQFLEKIVDELDGSFYIVTLIPARTDTKYFHDLILSTAEQLYFIKGRLKFSEAKNSAPFPSCVVIFKAQTKDQICCPAIRSLEKPKNVRHKPAL